MEKGDIHVSYGRKGLVVSDIGEQIFLGLFILVKILPLCLCQWECSHLWFGIVCLVVVVLFSFKILPFLHYLFCFQTPADVHGWIVFRRMNEAKISVGPQLWDHGSCFTVTHCLPFGNKFVHFLLAVRQWVRPLPWNGIPFVVHQTESWRWHLAIKKGHFASKLINRPASGSKGQRLDHWGLIAQLCDTQGISGKHWDHAGSLGTQGCTAALEALFLPWSFPPKEHLLQVFWQAQKKIQDPEDGSHSRSPTGHWWKFSFMQFCKGSPCSSRFLYIRNSSLCSGSKYISGIFSDPKLHPPEIPQIPRASAHLGMKKLSIYSIHTHLRLSFGPYSRFLITFQSVHLL